MPRSGSTDAEALVDHRVGPSSDCWSVSGSALRQQLRQELRCFSLGLEGDAVPGQLVFEAWRCAGATRSSSRLAAERFLRCLGAESRTGHRRRGPGCHSTMWLEYRPSRRSSAPLPPSSVDSFVLLQDGQLVVGAELAPLGPGCRIVLGHGPILGARLSQAADVMVIWSTCS